MKSSVKNVQNLKNTVKGILLFCNKISNKKLEDSTFFLARKLSPSLMANKAINKFLTASIEKGVINIERELTMTFVKGYTFSGIMFSSVL